MTSWHGGKGSQPRPIDKQKFDNNWDAIFNKNKKVKEDKDVRESRNDNRIQDNH